MKCNSIQQQEIESTSDIAILTVTSPIVINVPTRGLLAVETKDSLFCGWQNVTLLHQNQQIQNLYSTTCGYFCLYFLNEMNKGVDYFDLLQVFKQDTNYNEKFIERYFKKLEK